MAVLGSLWDDDGMILWQVVDDRTNKGLNVQWIPPKPSTASKSGEIFRGAGGHNLPASGERTVTGQTITKTMNQVYLDEEKAFVKINKRGRSRNSDGIATCGCLTCG